MRFWLSILLVALSWPARAEDPAVVFANANGNAAHPYREGWFGGGDTRLHYVEAGDGPLILFVHGFPSFWFSWFDQMEALKARYRVVAIDALGAGQSGKPQRLEPYRVGTLARQIDALAKHLNGNRRFVLIGHDWGAALAFAYSQGFPRRLNGVVGMSAPPYNLFLDLVRDSPEQQARSGYMQTFRTLTLADIERRGLSERFWRQSYGGLIASGALSPAEGELFRTALADSRAINGGMHWYRANIPMFDAISPSDYWPQRRHTIKVPTLLIWGQDDRTFVASFVDMMRQQNARMSVVTVDGVGHWTSIERPQAATDAIAGFLAGLRPKPTIVKR